MKKESLRTKWLESAENCAKSHAEFQRKWYSVSLTSAGFGLLFAVSGTTLAILGVYLVFFSQIPVVAWFLWNARDLERKRAESGKEWLEMRQFRLEMADQYR